MYSTLCILGVALLAACQPPPKRILGDARSAGTSDSGHADATLGSCTQSWQSESGKWAECMQLATWQATGMDQVPFQETTGGPCYQCHRAGIAGVFLSENSEETFESARVLPFLGMLISPEYDEEECLVQLVRSRRLLDKENAPSTFHPTFQWSPERKQAIRDFYDATQIRYDAGACDT